MYFKISQYVTNRLDIEELTQDVFISFYNAINITTIHNIKYYLIVSAKNKSIDFLKKKKIELVLDDNFIYEKHENEESDYNDIIELMQLTLNQTEIDIILKHLIDGYSFKELSLEYDRKINTIISIYHRGLKKLRKGKTSNER